MVAIGQLLASILPAGAADFISALFGNPSSTASPASKGKLTSIIDSIVDSITSVFSKIVSAIGSLWGSIKTKIWNMIDSVLGFKRHGDESDSDVEARKNRYNYQEEEEKINKQYEEMKIKKAGNAQALKELEDWKWGNLEKAKKNNHVGDFAAGSGGEKSISVNGRTFSLDKRDGVLAAPFGSLLSPQKYTGLSKESTDLASAINSPIVAKLDELIKMMAGGKTSSGAMVKQSPTFISMGSSQRQESSSVVVDSSSSVS
jgi:hypothetical protein